MLRRLLAGAIVLALAIPAARAADQVRMVQSSTGLLYVPSMAALELGYFKDAGIDASLNTGFGGAEALAAVIGNDAEVYIGAPSSSLRARDKGTDPVVFGDSMTQYGSNVVVTKEWADKHGITAASSYKDKLKALKGGQWGVVGIGSGTHQLMMFLAKQAGIDPKKDLTVVNIVQSSAMLAAFKQRRIDGFSMSSPTSDVAVKDDNGVMLFHTSKGEVKELDGYLYIGFIARQSWLKAHHDAAARFLGAVQRALDDIHDPAKTGHVRDVIHAKYAPKVEKAFFDQIWADTVPAWPEHVRVTPEQAKRVVGFLNEFSSPGFDPKLAETGFDFSFGDGAKRQ